MNTFAALLITAFAQAPQVHYTLTIDTANLGVLAVAMEVRNAPASFTVAARAHPEYDDKYWRYVESMHATGAEIVRRDSVLWSVTSAQKNVTLRYIIRLPEAPAPRAAWRAYLTRNGGLVGGPHSFLYIVGAEAQPATVTLELPRGWQAATALPSSGQDLSAVNVFTLMESPILIGQLRDWQFRIENVPHHIYYLGGVQAAAFDTAVFIGGVQRIVAQAAAIFRTMPYQNYSFLIADDAYGGLEHPSSVTFGVQSSDLAKNPLSHATEFAHEYFHTWNLMAIKPREYHEVDYRVQQPVPSLWFSEGATLFYADAILRRAGIATSEQTRLVHLQLLLGRYLTDPAYEKFSPETISKVEYNSAPGALGNNDPSTHLVGEVITTALDLIVRGATDGRRNMDDVMRRMEARHVGTITKGYTSHDVERAVADECGCKVHDFFERHVRAAARIDMNQYLAVLGLRMSARRIPAVLESGEVERDLRIRALQPTPQDTPLVRLWNEESIWARAGLKTNDRVLTVNGATVKTWPEFRSAVAAVPMGETITFAIVRDGQKLEVPVVMSGYERVRVEITELPNRTARQQAMAAAWLAGR